MRFLFLFLLMIGFVSAVDIDFDCPPDIFVDEEFECLLEVFDGDGEYDVKIDLDGERNSVLEVFNDGVWKSGYYYLLEFIEDGEERDIRLRVSDDGNWDGELKLRQGDDREFFDIDIEVEVEERDEIEDVGSEEIVLIEEGVVLSLNGEEEIDELVYVSKDGKIVDWLPYGFAVFLIFIIGILLWERF